MHRTLAAGIALLAVGSAALADSSATPILRAGETISLDTGTIIMAGSKGSASSTPDLAWSGTALTPQIRATAIAVPQLKGQAAYDSLAEVTASSFKAISSAAAIPSANLPVDQVIVVFTNGGHVAKLLVTENDSSGLAFRYTTFVGSVATGPSISQVLNNSSRISPGLPHYGIAPSSIFVVTGSGLADPTDPVLQSSAGPGLPLTLNGASLSVIVGGVTTHPAIYYTTPTQIAAVLPARTPLGAGTLSLTYKGATATSPIQVVANALGINLYNGAGVATDASTGSLITYSNSASPGQTIVLWTTGLGADPLDSDTTFTASPHSVSAPLHIYIGGVEAPILYQGSAGYPGVNQINLTIPSSAPPGCFVALAAVVGSQIDHTVTLPIRSGGGVCLDPVTGFTGDQIAPSGGQTLRTGLVSVLQGNAADARTGNITTTNSADAAFQKYSGLYPSNNMVSPGSCIIYDLTPVPTPSLTGLDAGTITLSGPTGSPVTLASQLGIKGAFFAQLAAGAIPQTGGSFTFKATGGADVGSFTSTLTFANPLLNWTNRSAVSSILKTRDLTITWSGGNPGTYVNIYGSSTVVNRATNSTVTGAFACEAAVEAGQFTVPAYILSALPDGSGGFGIQNGFFQPLTASGLDNGVAGGTITHSATAQYTSSTGTGR
ncbi:MAG TPA: hypothetical protein VMH28_13225 [Candidatus Acidoferrales bacterium]|nr:hypothetical protein [Candidatus Acidoferrales bacterium]